MQLQVIKRKKFWFGFSLTLNILAVIAVIVYGLNFGIDFTGGSILDVKTEIAIEGPVLHQTLVDVGFEEARVQPSENQRFLIRTRALNEEEHQQVLSTIKNAYGNVEELRFDSIGPVIGQELRQKSVWALGLVLILIMVYIAWAFRKVSEPVSSWKYGVITIIAALHDVIIPIGVFAVLGHYFDVQIDTAFVAAILTILGYSINDTIVVFDRTRENLMLAHKQGHEDFEVTVNKSINQTLARSLNTSFTTLLGLIAVYFFGGESTQTFALALLIGVTAGAYSSIFVASPLLVVWQHVTKRV